MSNNSNYNANYLHAPQDGPRFEEDVGYSQPLFIKKFIISSFFNIDSPKSEKETEPTQPKKKIAFVDENSKEEVKSSFISILSDNKIYFKSIFTVFMCLLIALAISSSAYYIFGSRFQRISIFNSFGRDIYQPKKLPTKSGVPKNY